MVMAHIYANCGRYDEAIEELDYALSLETVITVNNLKFLRWTEPLRGHERFETMMEEYSL
jgi:hypothetical protein